MNRLWILLWSCTFSGALSAQAIQLADPYPLAGQATTIGVYDTETPVVGAVVVVTYRPNSQTVSKEVLPPTNAQGEVSWTPNDSGIVTLTAHERSEDGKVLGSLSASVRFGTFPGAGLVVMFIAGVLLFGGALLGMVMLLREGQAPAPDPPST